MSKEMSSLYIGLAVFCLCEAKVPECDTQPLPANSCGLYSVHCRGGHAQLFVESAIATSQLEGSTSAIAIPQLFKECCSATATPQFCNRNFSEVRNFKSATWELYFRNFWQIFGLE
jgi:hypothetical protein